MSSVSIISGVAARIKSMIREPTDLQRLLLSEMESITKLLKAADLETKTSRPFLALEKPIVQLSYEAEEAIALAIIQSKRKKETCNKLWMTTSDPEPETRNCVSNLIYLKTTLKYIVENYSCLAGISGDEDVGAAAVERQVRESLRGSSSVVCIYGATGSGKTTLAKKVFDDHRAEESFMSFVWVRVNRECKPAAVFAEILHQLCPAKKKADIGSMDEIETIDQIVTIQTERRCLLVLEDVWAVHDWDNIRCGLVVDRSTRTIITTASYEVAANMVKSKYPLCKMQPLNGTEILTLLKNKARFDDPELKLYGEIISRFSQGSPLFAAVLGKSYKTASDELVDELSTYTRRTSQRGIHALDACYDILADELKVCWLYMGQFPEGQAIKVEKLHFLLEAEGIMPPEDYVRDVMEKLALRKLVKLQEDKESMTGMYKSCQLHELIQNFCISKGLEKELFEIIRVESGKKAIKIANSTRRLAVYLSSYRDQSVITFINHLTAKKIRSILIFDTLGRSERNTTKSSKIEGLEQFTSLRVLDFDGVDFKLRVEDLTRIDKFVSLRYLSFRRCWLENLPSCIGEFQILETLDLRVRSGCSMFIPNNIFSNMKTLKNLYFPLSYTTKMRATLQLSSLERLEILVNFHTGVCNVKDISKLTNLQILTTISEENHRNLADILKIFSKPVSNLQRSSFIIRDFDCYSADRVFVLKNMLDCKSLHSLHVHGHINRLPKDVVISPNLSEIALDSSEIEDDPEVVLRRLNNLRSIVLSNNVFVKEHMSIVFRREFFPDLRSLKLLNLPNLETLQFDGGSMPKLSTLVVEDCAELVKVSMPKALHNRLQAVRRKKGDDVYSVGLTPTII